MVEIVGKPLRAAEGMRAREAKNAKGEVYRRRSGKTALTGLLALLRGVAVARNDTKNAENPKETRLHAAQACPHGYWGVGNTLT